MSAFEAKEEKLLRSLRRLWEEWGKGGALLQYVRIMTKTKKRAGASVE